MLLIFTVAVLRGHAQHPDENINAYSDSYPSEQTYLHFDNSLYSPGDTVWFKAYVLANSSPSNYSFSLYVDWFDEGGKRLQHQAYPIQQARCNGQFVVPRLYKNLKIHVLAYTKWMLNSDTDYLFRKTIDILPFKLQPVAEQKVVTQHTTMQFFAEGGNFVAGVVNKIAFKATDQFGNPVEVAGTVKNNQGDSIINFKTMHDGMGYFYITPNDADSYTAYYHSSSNDSSINLPSVQPSGIAMQVGLQGEGRQVVIRRQEALPPNANKINLLVTLNGYNTFAAQINLAAAKETSIPVDVPIANTISGIATFTLFDENWHPLAERISFIKGKDIQNDVPQLSIVKQDMGSKGLNTIQIQSGTSLPSNLSVAITDANLPADAGNNIISYLLLTGQLKGKVNNPAYYFEDSAQQKEQQLDLVMLTNGWRRYDWNAVTLNTKPTIAYPRDSMYLFLRGSLEDKKNKFPQLASFIIKNGALPNIVSYPINSNGVFIDSTFLLFDTTQITYHATNNSKEYNFVCDQLYNNVNFSTYQFPTDITATKIAEKAASTPLEFYKTTLPDVTVTTTTYKKIYQTTTDSIESLYESKQFQNAPALKSIYVANDPILSSYGSNGFKDFILAKLSIDISQTYPVNYAQTLQYCVNEQFMPKDAVTNMPVIDIVFLKYYKYLVSAPALTGGFAALSQKAGVIAIWTKQGFASEAPPQEKDQAARAQKIIGYTISEEFYSPNYSETKNKDAITDNRKTLYWNPDVNLDNGVNKSLNLSFYNNDFAKRYRVIIQGIKTDGTPVYIERTVE